MERCFTENLVQFLSAAAQLKPVTVDLRKDENRQAHKTDDYEMQELIVRRGQTFDVTVTFDRDYSPKNDVIVVQFVTGTAEWLFYLKGIVSWFIKHI